MSKREARIERANAKLLKAGEKSARLRDRAEPVSSIRIGADPSSIFQMQMTWSFNNSDCSGTWSWGEQRQWSSEIWASIIEPKLTEFSKLTWAEIDRLASGSGHKMHHNMAVDVICDEAQYRLIELENENDPIFRFRLGNKRRLWGFRTVAEFEILWFDGAHKIYPVEPD